MNRRGYVGLSATLVFAAVFLSLGFYSNANPAGALCNYDANCDSGHCVTLGGEINSVGTCVECIDNLECPSRSCQNYECSSGCGYTVSSCDNTATNNIYFTGTCASSGNANCVGRCSDLGICCTSDQGETDAYECTGCPGGYVWSNSQSCGGYNHCVPQCGSGTYLSGCSCLPEGPGGCPSGQVSCGGVCITPTCTTSG